jgi:hypothetical protein
LCSAPDCFLFSTSCRPEAPFANGIGYSYIMKPGCFLFSTSCRREHLLTVPQLYNVNSSVADPHWFQCGSGSSILDHCGFGPGSGSGSRGLMIKKLQMEKSIFYEQILQFTYPETHKGRPSYRRSLRPSKQNIFHLIT